MCLAGLIKAILINCTESVDATERMLHYTISSMEVMRALKICLLSFAGKRPFIDPNTVGLIELYKAIIELKHYR